MRSRGGGRHALLAAGAFQSQPARLSLLLLTEEKCYSQAGFLTTLIAGLIAQICSIRRFISSLLQLSCFLRRFDVASLVNPRCIFNERSFVKGVLGAGETSQEKKTT